MEKIIRRALGRIGCFLGHHRDWKAPEYFDVPVEGGGTVKMGTGLPTYHANCQLRGKNLYEKSAKKTNNSNT